MKRRYHVPTTYLSPEECAAGEGLRCLHDPHWLLLPEPDPLPSALLAEIEEALVRRKCEFLRLAEYSCLNHLTI
jgi:hypothetical protein